MQGRTLSDAQAALRPRAAVERRLHRRHVGRAALLHLDGYARLVLHHILAAHRQDLHLSGSTNSDSGLTDWSRLDAYFRLEQSTAHMRMASSVCMADRCTDSRQLLSPTHSVSSQAPKQPPSAVPCVDRRGGQLHVCRKGLLLHYITSRHVEQVCVTAYLLGFRVCDGLPSCCGTPSRADRP